LPCAGNALAEHLNTLVMNHWRLEVIGNIYENRQLLEPEAKQ